MTTIPSTTTAAKVSVIIPSYNMAAYLPQTIDSIINQDYQSLEIIVSDDGSTDNTQAVVAEYIQRYPERIKYVLHPNGGESAARNAGIAASDAEFLMFVDGDDLLLPGAVSSLMGKMLQLDQSYCLVQGEMLEVEYPSGRELRTTEFHTIAQNRYRLFTEMTNMILASVVRKSAMTAIGNFPDHVKWSAITEVMMKLAKIGKFYSLAQVVYHYRVRADSMSKGMSYERAKLLTAQSQARLEVLLPGESLLLQVIAWSEHYLRAAVNLRQYERSVAMLYLLKAFILRPWRWEPLQLWFAMVLGRF